MSLSRLQGNLIIEQFISIICLVIFPRTTKDHKIWEKFSHLEFNTEKFMGKSGIIRGHDKSFLELKAFEYSKSLFHLRRILCLDIWRFFIWCMIRGTLKIKKINFVKNFLNSPSWSVFLRKTNFWRRKAWYFFVFFLLKTFLIAKFQHELFEAKSWPLKHIVIVLLNTWVPVFGRVINFRQSSTVVLRQELDRNVLV